MNRKDFLDENVVKKPFLVLRDENLIQIINDSKYFPILRILREKPLTVKEIHAKYNAEQKKPKEEVTIRQYIKILEDANLIAKAGQSITEGKIAAEVLYDRTANFYLPVVLSENYWKSDENEIIIQKAQQILSLSGFKTKFTPESLRNLLFLVYSKAESKIGNIFEEYTEELTDILSQNSAEEIVTMTNFLLMYVLLTNPSIYKDEL